MSYDDGDGLEGVANPQYSHHTGMRTHNDPWRTALGNVKYLERGTVTLDPGYYFVGDLRLALNSDEILELQSHLLNNMEGLIQLKSNRIVVIWCTLESRGAHIDDQGEIYLLSSPYIGITTYTFDYFEGCIEEDNIEQKAHQFFSKKPVVCSCRDGHVKDAAAESTDSPFQVRLLKFGEQVSFTLYPYASNINMSLLSDNQTKEVISWRKQSHQTEGDHFSNTILKIIKSFGLEGM